MKSYPSIDNKIYALTDEERQISWSFFPKYDGSNFRVEWNSKKGFYKFGSRSQLVDASHPVFGEAIELAKQFEARYQSELVKLFRTSKWESVVCFFEFWGQNSFAGEHSASEPHYLTLIDISPHRKGILPPEQFVNITTTCGLSDNDVAPCIHTGPLTPELIDLVKIGKFPGATEEGVVAKNVSTMLKIKSTRWVERATMKAGDNKALLAELL